MEKADLLDRALEKIFDELDEIEGKVATSHSAEDCPDPLNCPEHESELGEHLSPEKLPGESEPAAVKIEVHKMGMPTLDGKKAEEGLSPEEAEELKKLLK